MGFLKSTGHSYALVMTAECEVEYVYSQGLHYLYVSIVGLITTLQLLLFSHTLYHERVLRNDRKYTKNYMMRGLFITMQLVGLLWIFSDILKNIIDPHTLILRDSVFCKIFAYFAYYIPAFYYCIVCSIILNRLEMSFKGSYLAVSKSTLYILRTLVLLIPIACWTSLIIDDTNLNCVHSWKAPDLDRTLTFCVVPSALLIAFRFYIFPGVVLLINGLNATFGILFTVKLRKFVNMNRQNTDVLNPSKQRKQFQFEALIIKNDLLVITGCISTTIGFLMWNITKNMLWMYGDMITNSCIIAMMFGCNQWYYKKLCSLCILMCFKQCNPYGSETEMAKRTSQRAFRYVHRAATATDTGDDIVTPRTPDSGSAVDGNDGFPDTPQTPQSSI